MLDRVDKKAVGVNPATEEPPMIERRTVSFMVSGYNAIVSRKCKILEWSFFDVEDEGTQKLLELYTSLGKFCTIALRWVEIQIRNQE